MWSHVKNQLHSLSEIFFLGDWRWGAVLLAALGARPWLLCGGLIALAAAQGLARLSGARPENPGRRGAYVVNPFLVGLAVTAASETSWSAAGLAAGGGMAALAVTALANRPSEAGTGLPVLSLPFSITAMALELATGRHAAMSVPGAVIPPSWNVVDQLTQCAAGYSRAMGSVVFMPEVSAGAVLAAMVFFRSRMLFLLSIYGYAAATGVNGLLGPAAGPDVAGFNGILTALALGGVFFVPSRRGMVPAILGVPLAALAARATAEAFAGAGLPVLTLPFVAATWAMIAAARAAGNPMVPVVGGTTPESLLEANIVHRLRFPDDGPMVHLPFAGEWTVWQGVDGEWTHRGPWRHAFDFVITDADDRQYAGSGRQLTDYYAFGKPVLAPCSGRVAAVVNDVPDNPVGSVDQDRRWGNLVVIAHPGGAFVEISHFAAGSIGVFEGQWVQRGALLGRCGNSGYSPAPHIHIQVQHSAVIGAATIPFCFAGCLTDGGRRRCAVPATGQRVAAVWPSPEMVRLTDLRLGEMLHMIADGPGASVVSKVISVEMDDDGTTCLASDTGRLYYSRRDDALVFYRLEGSDALLETIYTVLPRIPHVLVIDDQWGDWLPAGLRVGPIRRTLLALAGVWFPETVALRTWHRVTDHRTLETRISSLPAGVELHSRTVFGRGRLFHRLELDGRVLTLVPATPDSRMRVRTAETQSAAPVLCSLSEPPCPGNLNGGLVP